MSKSIDANDPNRRSWVHVPPHSDFPIQNLPLGIYSDASAKCRPCTAIGHQIADLHSLFELGYFDNLGFEAQHFAGPVLNPLLKEGRHALRRLRNALAHLFDVSNTRLSANEDHRHRVLRDQSAVVMEMPVAIGDYTDFYSSIEHATNVGTMFRDPANALLPNWKHLPVGYHGRSSSIVPSGTPIRRPMGQTRPNDSEPPIFGPSRQLDFELEVAFITCEGKPLGERITPAEAENYIAGLVLFNDWSARDIQKWEYVPLGPFLAKNFASSISPWLVLLDALEPFRVSGPTQEPAVLPYLQCPEPRNIDLHLEVAIQPDGAGETVVCRSNFRHMYWSMAQQLAHHTVGGCNVRCGDVMASGTISGPTPNSYGSMLELAWKGTKPIAMSDGSDRRFIHDGDTVTMRGWCQSERVRIGFGEVRTKVLPATPYPNA
jgi:fumarylacetoacetase